MRCLAFLVVGISTAYGQALVEHAAAAAGGATGAVAGKRVSDGIDKVFRKVDDTLKKSADQKNAPILQVGPAQVVPKAPGVSVAASPSPEPAGVVSGGPRRVSTPRAEIELATPAVAPPVVTPPPPPPRPEVKIEDLRAVEAGTPRQALLAKLGPPAAKLTMFDDGKLVEVYRYMSGDTTLGAVRLADGTVASVLLSRQ